MTSLRAEIAVAANPAVPAVPAVPVVPAMTAWRLAAPVPTVPSCQEAGAASWRRRAAGTEEPWAEAAQGTRAIGVLSVVARFFTGPLLSCVVAGVVMWLGPGTWRPVCSKLEIGPDRGK